MLLVPYVPVTVVPVVWQEIVTPAPSATVPTAATRPCSPSPDRAPPQQPLSLVYVRVPQYRASVPLNRTWMSLPFRHCS
jgi:hypothetical protein